MKGKIKELMPVLKYFGKYKSKMIIFSSILFITNLSYALLGYLIGEATSFITKNEIKLCLLFLLIYFIVEITADILGNLAKNKINHVQSKVARTVGYDVYSKMLEMPATAFEDMSSGQIINRITHDTDKLVGQVQIVIRIVSQIISSLLILVYIIKKSLVIAGVIIVFLISYYWVVKYYTKKLNELNKQRKKENDKFTNITTESVRGIREIKTLNIESSLRKNVKTIIDNLLNASYNEMDTGRNYYIMQAIFCTILEVGTFMIAAYLVYVGNVSLAFFMSMTYYIYRYIYIIENITDFSSNFEDLLVSLNRISEILGNKLYEDTKYGLSVINNPEGRVEFKNVSFGYPNEKEILKDFNINFEPNKKIAIVGPSGEGKSTLFNLLTRLFDPSKGEILIDGVNINNLTKTSLRKNVSIIRQDPFIFNRSILDNFRLLDENVSLKEVRKYTKMASIDEYIESLPNKYDTILGEGGVNLSGGQKQRLAIARTLMKKSKIILFDEATSALDNESQEVIKEAINEFAKDHTVLIIAHRLSTIKDADVIYVIKGGKVIASGKHQKLMKDCEFYKNLYKKEELK